MKTITYKVKFHTSLHLREQMILDKIENVLSDQRGLIRLGYHFEYTTTSPHITINFVPDTTVTRICSFKGLSCADLSNNHIYINIKRWQRGASASKLSLDDYRTYLLQHEILHLLGRDHVQCGRPGTKVPVMVQQTLGIGQCKPNPWPLYWE